ncbi:hypothetical protein SAMN05428975_0899 [Mucilaginibacter sp. OK268]|uniref:hypothetical protein n=1 Tax=Mucilaginibacter sp. OK268 TaxID=1881048 RepID=UPI00088D87B0|nr:hypothetical protein [Mucilaginibacter sp. OK268]SDP25973.1 hypothetical protein SAMN05428975_0899 [Mucilaginibacter sp. OK268]
MKKALFIYFMLLGVTLLSCKKDNHTKTNPTGKFYPVSFSLSGFTSTIDPINQNSKIKVNTVDPSASTVVKLIYKLFDSNNSVKKTLIINKGAPNFGTITDSLAAGTYTAAFVGLTDTIPADFGDTGLIFNYRTYAYFPETFYSNVHFTVGNTPVQQNSVLKRLNSEVQVIIKDAIPSGVSRINITIIGAYQACTYLDGKSTGSNTGGESSTPITNANVGTTNFPLSPVTRLFNNTSTVNILIDAISPNGTDVAFKTINNVTLQPNVRTILTGNVFSNDGSTGGFAVTFDPNYSGNLSQSF